MMIINEPNTPPPSSLKGTGKSLLSVNNLLINYFQLTSVIHYYCLQCNHAGQYGYKQNYQFSLYYIVIIWLGFYEINVLHFYFNGCEII